MNLANLSLAEESGIDLDSLYNESELTEADFQFQCLNCDYIGTGEDFEDMECDGDIIGYCPSCKGHHILIDLSKEDYFHE